MNRRLIVGRILFVVIFICRLLIADCQQKVKVEERKISQTYTCHQTTGKIKIDGLLGEKDWQKVRAINFYHLKRADSQDYKEAESPTVGRLLWGKGYLYVSFNAYDKDIWIYYPKRDEPSREDVLEVFLGPDAQKLSYYNKERND